MIRGSKLATNMHFLPISTAQSGKYKEMPETICRGFSSQKSTDNLSNLSVSGTFSAVRILPTTISTFLNSSRLIIFYYYFYLNTFVKLGQQLPHLLIFSYPLSNCHND